MAWISTDHTHDKQAPRWPYRVVEGLPGLVSCWTFANHPFPQGDQWVLGNKLSETATVSRLPTGGRYGKAIGSHVTGTGGTGYLSATGHQRSAWTHEAIVVMQSAPSATTGIAIWIIAESPSSTTRDRCVGVANTDTTGAFYSFAFDGSNHVADATTQPVVGRAYHLVASCQANDLRIYVDGVLEDTNTAITSGGFGSYTSPEHVFGLGAAGVRGGAGDTSGDTLLLLARDYDRVLSAAEVAVLASNPWQFHEEYGRRAHFLPFAAPGGSVVPQFYHHRHHNRAA